MSEAGTILQALRDTYRANPEELDNAPSNEQIIAGNADLVRWPKPLTAGERAGFLEQWKMGLLREQLTALTPEELTVLREELVVDIYAVPHLPKDLEELRIIQGMAAVAISNGKNKEQTNG